jgi:hypothetical protein
VRCLTRRWVSRRGPRRPHREAHPVAAAQPAGRARPAARGTPRARRDGRGRSGCAGRAGHGGRGHHRRDVRGRHPKGSRTPSCSSPHARTAMVPRIRALGGGPRRRERKCRPRSTTSASSPHCGWRACAPLAEAGIRPDLVILDGNHDWLTAPQDVGLFAFDDDVPAATPAGEHDDQGRPEVLVGRRGLGAGQGAPRRDHGRAGGAAPRLRLGREQGVRRAWAPRRAAAARAVRAAPALVGGSRAGGARWPSTSATARATSRSTSRSTTRRTGTPTTCGLTHNSL